MTMSEDRQKQWEAVRKMKLESLVRNALVAQRAAALKLSPQLLLVELILKMEFITNKELPVVFDDGKYHPTKLSSWRGSYCELALEYNDTENKKSVKELLVILKEAIGKTYTGYKGGDFIMDKATPVWVANYGNSNGFKNNKEFNPQAVIDIEQKDNMVIIKTECLDY